MSGKINPRDVKPETAGTLFMVPVRGAENSDSDLGYGVYKATFMRVRVVLGQVNMADVQDVANYAKKLASEGVPFITFSAGRNVPYPEYPGDLEELKRNAGGKPGLIQ